MICPLSSLWPLFLLFPNTLHSSHPGWPRCFFKNAPETAFAVFPAAWKALLPDVCMTNSLTSFKYLLQVTLLIRSILFVACTLPPPSLTPTTSSLYCSPILFPFFISRLQVLISLIFYLFSKCLPAFSLSSLLDYKAKIFVLFTETSQELRIIPGM